MKEKKYFVTYDEEESLIDKLKKDPEKQKSTFITIGYWKDAYQASLSKYH